MQTLILELHVVANLQHTAELQHLDHSRTASARRCCILQMQCLCIAAQCCAARLMCSPTGCRTTKAVLSVKCPLRTAAMHSTQVCIYITSICALPSVNSGCDRDNKHAGQHGEVEACLEPDSSALSCRFSLLTWDSVSCC